MIELLILVWIAIKLSAPIWIYALLATSLVIKILQWGINIGERSNENNRTKD